MPQLSRPLGAACALMLCSSMVGQQATTASAPDISAALAGHWTGELEYRDYKEPAASLKRVALPTWLSVTPTGQAEAWHYIYDDGPGKVVEEDEQVTFDMLHDTCTFSQPGKAAQTYQVMGYAALRNGRGTVVLSGTGTDSGKPSDMRLTLTVGRNLFSLLQEVRLSGTQDAFAYRHLYRFVRAEAPVVTPK